MLMQSPSIDALLISFEGSIDGSIIRRVDRRKVSISPIRQFLQLPQYFFALNPICNRWSLQVQSAKWKALQSLSPHQACFVDKWVGFWIPQQLTSFDVSANLKATASQHFVELYNSCKPGSAGGTSTANIVLAHSTIVHSPQ